jgi:hypothetical protein
MIRVVQRAFRYRFYPTDVQAEQLKRTFGCVRLVYNKALDARTRAYASQQRRISYGQTSALLTGGCRRRSGARPAGGWPHRCRLACGNGPAPAARPMTAT